MMSSRVTLNLGGWLSTSRVRVWFVCGLLTCVGIARANSNANTNAATADRHVILVSLDGFAQFLLDDPHSDLATLRQLAREGAVAQSGMTCSFPTVTWPNHTTLVTGVPPARHGVLGNAVYNREKQERIGLLIDPIFDKDQIVRSPTIYDVAHQAGLKTAGVNWPATRNAKSLDLNIPDMAGDLMPKFATTTWIEELKKEKLPYDRYGDWVKAKEGGPRRDWMATRAAINALTTHKANLVLLHLVELDHVEHAVGPNGGDVSWAVSTMDDRLRDLRDAIEAAGMRDKTTVIVVSDHGFFDIDKNIHANVELQRLGLIQTQAQKVVSKQAWTVSQGGGAAVYILDQANRDAIATKIKQAMLKVEGIEAVFEPGEFAKIGQSTMAEDPHSPDLWLAAKKGYSFSEGTTSEQIVTRVPRAGTHGFLPESDEMHGILIAWGAGIKPGTKLGRIKNTQVAPTIARLLGLEFPSADGKPLESMLSQVGKN